jgi:RimJ/RimL family protein N-acetyltransferase
MLELEKINHSHFKDIFDLHWKFLKTFDFPSIDHFVVYFYRVEGWVIKKNGKIIACLYLDNYNPGLSIIIHAVSNPEYKARWINRNILRTVGDYVFNTLGVARMGGYSLIEQGLPPGTADPTGKFLTQIGFMEEGKLEKGAFARGMFYDLKLFGMLKEKCKWI